MTTNKSVVRSYAPQETATECGYVDLQVTCQLLGCSQPSTSRWITNGISLGIIQLPRMHKTL